MALTFSTKVSLDRFGVAKFFPSVGREWFSNWDNGYSRQIVSRRVNIQNLDPYDRESDFHASSDNTCYIDGKGIMKLSGHAPRFYVHDPYTFPPPENIRKWQNVEMTCYGMLLSLKDVSSLRPSEGSKATTFSLRARSNHQDHGRCACNGNGYISEWGIRASGAFRWRHGFRKEFIHPHYAEQTWPSLVIKHEPSMQVGKWVGHKFICRNVNSARHVLLQSWRDDTDALNGGQWVKVNEYIDKGGWKVNPDDILSGSFQNDLNTKCSDCCLDGPPPGGVNTDVIWTSPRISCYLRTDNVEDMRFKNFSIREISPLP